MKKIFITGITVMFFSAVCIALKNELSPLCNMQPQSILYIMAAWEVYGGAMVIFSLTYKWLQPLPLPEVTDGCPYCKTQPCTHMAPPPKKLAPAVNLVRRNIIRDRQADKDQVIP